MLHAFLKKGSFQDSVSLMLISRDLSKADDVNRVSIMMGTPANKDVFRETGMWHDILKDAGPNDICVVIDSDSSDDRIVGIITTRLEEAFTKLAQGRKGTSLPIVHSFERARKTLPDANITLISIPGMYADQPALQALENNQHVMLFSDNVSVENEVKLKTIGRKKGLLVMGPDCGTSIINGAPLAFANRMPKGHIGIIGASGTGIQELCSQIALHDAGITHAIGLGGRDLSEKVGGLSALTALEMLDRDPETRVIAFVSKPPAESVRDGIAHKMASLSKPVVALFLGSNPKVRQKGNVYFAYTLDEAAKLALDLSRIEEQGTGLPDVSRKKALGLFTGGTLAAETAMLLAASMGLSPDQEHQAGYMLKTPEMAIVDLGDDLYTRGRPHPMIDPSVRTERIDTLEDDVGVLLMDVVLGFGSNADPAGAVADSVKSLKNRRGSKNPIVVIATVTGTNDDPQNREEQVAKLQDAGILVLENPRQAVMLTLRLMNARARETHPIKQPTSSVLTDEPQVINIGLREFAEDLQTNQVRCVFYQWAPSCGGDERLQKLLKLMQ